ncbi:hypothetical protein TWF569_003192 [Orbilia oligospora]|uniref:Ig-like domain-containing protein n=1 Tax=Orbilia oligospora TaxID=2813651 RepID=A0A7C8JKP9_ORBOL|nr:hypothetical protein TWF706_010447 [Orbilia oligospora]KAF3098922.1 hypothetical protein TWF102_005964 [Orbilia oligospora]KAF3108189.1 hypothetical protein TWF103_005736 [Orbilia oligospora]KAF3124544.1 hypothetical protein TWF703_011297 [Orbilia oligospora]KAF3152149.1 hypothetical protein TWF569_003192 [Orbilia oligospora]
MKFTIVVLATAAAVNARLIFNETTSSFQCLGDAAGKRFCAGSRGSLTSNIIIRCDGERGQPGNCNDNLAGVPPIGVKTSALCWQSSETSGDADCSFNGIVYANDGTTFPITTSASSSTVEPTYGASSSSSAEPTYGESTTTTTIVEPTYAPTTSETSSIYPTLSWTNTSSIYYPPGTTLTTVTGTHTVTSCDTTTTVPVPPTSYAPPPTNTTSSYTTGLPVPTQSPSGAGALLAKDSLVLGVVALVGFMFL